MIRKRFMLSIFIILTVILFSRSWQSKEDEKQGVLSLSAARDKVTLLQKEMRVNTLTYPW